MAGQTDSPKKTSPRGKQQKTIAQTMPDFEHSDSKDADAQCGNTEDHVEKNGASSLGSASGKAKEDESNKSTGHKRKASSATSTPQKKRGRGDNETQESAKEDEEERKDEDLTEAVDQNDNGQAQSEDVKMENGDKDNDTAANGGESETKGQSGAVQSSQSRGDAQPSNILEKGIIYFFARPRVNVTQEDASGVEDIARSYMVLRPIAASAKIADGPIQDLENARLLALPKKVLPVSHSDRFMAFVEKGKASLKQLKEDFLQGGSYATQTSGTSTTAPVTPTGEGVYAITSTGRESHLAYMLTIPEKLGPVQEELGLANKGSFVLSTKNPAQKGPANASLDNPAEFSKEIMDEFRGRRWMPLRPEHLDYVNAQFLLIGEGHGDLANAMEAADKDKKNDQVESPTEELEKLEGEDEQRVEGLHGDDTVFDDLKISHEEYSKVPTTW